MPVYFYFYKVVEKTPQCNYPVYAYCRRERVLHFTPGSKQTIFKASKLKEKKKSDVRKQ